MELLKSELSIKNSCYDFTSKIQFSLTEKQNLNILFVHHYLTPKSDPAEQMTTAQVIHFNEPLFEHLHIPDCYKLLHLTSYNVEPIDKI